MENETPKVEIMKASEALPSMQPQTAAMVGMPIPMEELRRIEREAPERIRLMDNIFKAGLCRTNKNDWTNISGKPWLDTSGSEKLGRVFGVSWNFAPGYPRREERKDDDGNYYLCIAKGTVSLFGESVDVVGVRQSNEAFFTQNGRIPAMKVDENDIMQAAITRFVGSGVTRIIGMRNLTWEELEAAGIDISELSKGYTHGGKSRQRNQDGEYSVLSIKAKREGKCAVEGCGAELKSGDEIVWWPKESKVWCKKHGINALHPDESLRGKE